MDKAVDARPAEFATVRTGRAAPGAGREAAGRLLRRPRCRCSSSPASACPRPGCSSSSPTTSGSMGAIEKAIRDSDLGLNPSNDGTVIRLAFPPLTEERRKEYVKVVKHMAEDGRVAVRNVRRDARKHLEAAEKDGEISADELDRAEKELEKITHEHVERDRQGARPQGARAARGLSSSAARRRRMATSERRSHDRRHVAATAATSDERRRRRRRATPTTRRSRRRSSATADEPPRRCERDDEAPPALRRPTTPARCRTGPSRRPARCPRIFADDDRRATTSTTGRRSPPSARSGATTAPSAGTPTTTSTSPASASEHPRRRPRRAGRRPATRSSTTSRRRAASPSRIPIVDRPDPARAPAAAPAAAATARRAPAPRRAPRPSGHRAAPPGRDLPMAIGVGVAIAAVVLVAARCSAPRYAMVLVVARPRPSPPSSSSTSSARGLPARPRWSGLVAVAGLPLAAYWQGEAAHPARAASSPSWSRLLWYPPRRRASTSGPLPNIARHPARRRLDRAARLVRRADPAVPERHRRRASSSPSSAPSPTTSAACSSARPPGARRSSPDQPEQDRRGPGRRHASARWSSRSCVVGRHRARPVDSSATPCCSASVVAVAAPLGDLCRVACSSATSASRTWARSSRPRRRPRPLRRPALRAARPCYYLAARVARPERLVRAGEPTTAP